MLENLINNSDMPNEMLKLNTAQLIKLAKAEDRYLNVHINTYKRDYNLTNMEMYCNLALMHGGNN